jgi:hypothetical protein
MDVDVDVENGVDINPLSFPISKLISIASASSRAPFASSASSHSFHSGFIYRYSSSHSFRSGLIFCSPHSFDFPSTSWPLSLPSHCPSHQ